MEFYFSLVSFIILFLLIFEFNVETSRVLEANVYRILFFGTEQKKRSINERKVIRT